MTLTPVQQSAFDAIGAKLSTGGWSNPVTHAEVNDVAARLKGLSAQDADAVVDEMARTGELGRFAAEAVDGSWFGNGGYTDAERRDLFTDLAGKLDGASLARVSDAFARTSAGEDGVTRVGELADAVASHAPAAAKLDYVRSLAGETAAGKSLDDAPMHEVDAEAGAVGRVIASMRGRPAADALRVLASRPEQLGAVLRTGLDRNSVTVQGPISEYGRSAGSELTTFRPDGFRGVMAAAASTDDADLKARVFDAAADQLRTVRDTPTAGLGAIAPDRGPALATVRDSMTRLLNSDVAGVTRELTYNTPTQDGSDLAAYAQVMIATGQEAELGRQLVRLQLGNDLGSDPIARLDRVTPVSAQGVGAQGRRENAGALGYFTGAVYAGAAAHSKDVKAQQEAVTSVLKSAMTVLDKAGAGGKAGSTALGLGKDWVQYAVRAAISDPGATPAQKLERAALPQNPSTGELAVGDPVTDAFNTALSRVQRTAQP